MVTTLPTRSQAGPMSQGRAEPQPAGPNRLIAFLKLRHGGLTAREEETTWGESGGIAMWAWPALIITIVFLMMLMIFVYRCTRRPSTSQTSSDWNNDVELQPRPSSNPYLGLSGPPGTAPALHTTGPRPATISERQNSLDSRIRSAIPKGELSNGYGRKRSFDSYSSETVLVPTAPSKSGPADGPLPPLPPSLQGNSPQGAKDNHEQQIGTKQPQKIKRKPVATSNIPENQPEAK